MKAPHSEDDGMASIQITCPHCGEPAHAPANAAGMGAKCPSCGKMLSISMPVPVQAVPAPRPPRIPTIDRKATIPKEAMPVIVTDIRMSFSSMVIFMIKWAIASIPALLILVGVAGFTILVLFVGGCAGCASLGHALQKGL